MRRISKNWAVALTVGLLAIGGAAFAYWTTTGSGSDTADTGGTVPIVVNLTSTVTGLAPGLPAQALAGNFDNPNAGPVYVAAVTATVTGTNIPGCDATNYVVAGTAPVAVEVASGTGRGSWSGLTIQFVNKASNQNVCKNAVVNLSLASS